jgi:hypothetical protein
MQLTEPILQDPGVRDECRALLIDRRAKKVASNSSEFVIRGGVLKTVRQVEDLVRSRALDPFSQRSLFPVISRRFAELLGLDFKEVLCVPSEAAEYSVYQADIDKDFESSTEPDLIRRIQKAHQKWLERFVPEIRELVESKYFFRDKDKK